MTTVFGAPRLKALDAGAALEEAVEGAPECPEKTPGFEHFCGCPRCKLQTILDSLCDFLYPDELKIRFTGGDDQAEANPEEAPTAKRKAR